MNCFRPVLLILLGLSACRSTPERAPLADDPQLDAFARELEQNLRANAWQEVLAVADPDHYRIQVTEGGMGEPQYVAELLGLYRTDNNIRRGERIEWADLDRIASAELERVERAGGTWRIKGRVVLEDAAVLDVQARAVERDGRWRLTGGVG